MILAAGRESQTGSPAIMLTGNIFFILFFPGTGIRSPSFLFPRRFRVILRQIFQRGRASRGTSHRQAKTAAATISPAATDSRTGRYAQIEAPGVTYMNLRADHQPIYHDGGGRASTGSFRNRISPSAEVITAAPRCGGKRPLQQESRGVGRSRTRRTGGKKAPIVTPKCTAEKIPAAASVPRRHAPARADDSIGSASDTPHKPPQSRLHAIRTRSVFRFATAAPPEISYICYCT
jgi:hypothetical protein